MRSAVSTHLLAILILAIGLRGQASSPDRKKHQNPRRADAEPVKLFSCEVDGMGMSQPDALDVALGRARTAVETYLRSHNPPIEWPGLDDFLKQHVTEEKSVTKLEEGKKGDYQAVRLHVELNQADYETALRLDRQYRSQQRQQVLLRIAAGLVALLTAVAGYVWLDETTRGTYSRWLRLGAASLVGIVGAGWWLLS
jgi:hypothetical protein